MDSDKDGIYVRIVEVVRDYLGPASQRFIDRLLRNHLHKSPEDIDSEDIQLIVGWVKLAMALLTEDQEAIEECAGRLLAIQGKPRGSSA